jgi:hypothetical protein
MADMPGGSMERIESVQTVAVEWSAHDRFLVFAV